MKSLWRKMTRSEKVALGGMLSVPVTFLIMGVTENIVPEEFSEIVLLFGVLMVGIGTGIYLCANHFLPDNPDKPESEGIRHRDRVG